MRNVSNKSCGVVQQTHFAFNKHTLRPITFFSENPAGYVKMWKNSVEPGRPQMTIWCICTAC